MADFFNPPQTPTLTEQEIRLAMLNKNLSKLPPHVSEADKNLVREKLAHEESTLEQEHKRRINKDEFESLRVIGRGAFGEVRLVRTHSATTSTPHPPNASPQFQTSIFALKKMQKQSMVVKNQVVHVNSERNILAEAHANNRWLTVLHYSFQDEVALYMVMEYLPGGDLMGLLVSEIYIFPPFSILTLLKN